MNGSDDTANRYDLRRQSRGGDGPSAAVSPWRRRLVFIGAVVTVLLVVGGLGVVWYQVTFVPVPWGRLRAYVVELSPRVDGRIAEVRVTEGDVVTRGQVLARLDDRELTAGLDAALAELAMRETALREMEARESLTRTRIEADVAVAAARVEVSKAEVGSLEAEVVVRERRLPEQIREAEAVLAGSRADLQALLSGPRDEELAAAQERIASIRATLALYELEYRQSRELVDVGIDSQYILEVRRTRLETQQHTLKQAELELELLRAGPKAGVIEAARKEVEKEEAAVRQVQLGKEDLVRLRCVLDVSKAELQAAEALLRQAQDRRAELAVAHEQTEAARREVLRQQAVVEGRRAVLAEVEVISPVDGVVTRVYDEVGELSSRGVPMILVRDSSKPRWIDAFVDEEDAQLVSVGQKAHLRIPSNSWNQVVATVTRMGMHTSALDRAGGGESASASAVVQPDRVWLKLVPDEPLPEQTVTGTTARGRIRVR
ncbi:MAG: HlyD family efflux transporter periplasmic adaptor subunit [Lentisphaeria bacterium]|nr:HlyD family efflux transporter periplasmic adaptor subunit [Lentisphaeria bacterium]